MIDVSSKRAFYGNDLSNAYICKVKSFEIRKCWHRRRNCVLALKLLNATSPEMSHGKMYGAMYV